MFQVSWIRRSDLKILTIGDILYTQDQRFMPIHEEGSESWILKLTNPQVKDSGEYECQVSYHEDVEKKLTMPISLTVLGKKIDLIHFIMDRIESDFYEQKKIDLYLLTINTHFYEGRRQYFQYKSKFVRNGLNSMNSGTSSTNFRKGSIIESLFSFFI